MATEQGERYYQEWNQGRVTCKQVCLRSGAGLLAKFYSRRVEEAEEQKMLQLVLQEEAKLKDDMKRKADQTDEESRPTAAQSEDAKGASAGSLVAPAAWPSYQIVKPEVIQVDSQGDTPPQGAAMPYGSVSNAVTTELNAILESDASANAFNEFITAEENDRELAFAIAAGDVPENASTKLRRTVTSTAESGDVGDGHAAGSNEVERTLATANRGTTDEHVGRGGEGSITSATANSGTTNDNEGREGEEALPR